MGEHSGMTEQHHLAFADPRLGEDLLWRDVRVKPFPSALPALFLDRDGVIVEEKNYLADPDQVQLLPGVPELIQAARKAGMAAVEITNQAGIGRGYFGWAEFAAVENRVSELLAAKGVRLDAILACPFHSEGRPPYQHPDHPWRKPNPGMIREAARLLNLDLHQSLLIGDKAADQETARAAGLAGGIHVLTGYGRAQKEMACRVGSPGFSVQVVNCAAEAGALLALKFCAAGLDGERN